MCGVSHHWYMFNLFIIPQKRSNEWPLATADNEFPHFRLCFWGRKFYKKIKQMTMEIMKGLRNPSDYLAFN